MADTPDDTRSQDTDFAALWSSDGVTRSLSPTATGLPADLPFLFGPSQRFGAYRIVRPIGKGGMGQVYEAEETDSGRRIALKLLSRGLGDDEERERFLQEGQLAASLSHPNCVYVFGTNEIQGFPVIAMELVPEGTLKDLVVPGSPMSAAAAVDAVLQVVAGLEAAAAIGILHRDIKPSNCFVHRDGRVLVGDFGLSVATTSRDAQGGRAGTILGTPGFASPEQLRGESLDVRSDIYSVGATIFYLLAGRAPFDERTTTSLLAKVAAEPPPSLTVVRPDLPRGLAAIVTKCLAKTPGERFASYAALKSALEPFGTGRLSPAPILRRTLAGMLDAWLVSLPIVPINFLLRLRPLDASHGADRLITAASGLVLMILYYGLFEGLFGASPGKALFGLRVADEHHVAPGFPRATARLLVFEGPTQLLKESVTWIALRAVPNISVGFVTVVTGFICLAVLFSTARKKNGYTALHDRLTGTRVVRRRVRAEARERVQRASGGADRAFAGDERVGPYLVPPSTRLDVAQPERIDAYDDRLRRRVWIELLPAGTPALPASRRDLDRPTRVRWLTGRRDADQCWDAYEAIDGVNFEDAVTAPQPWSRVRHWLADLAHECLAGLEDGSLPALDPSRIWIGADGHVKLLEWSTSGRVAADPDAPRPDLPSVQRFLYGFASASLAGTAFDTALASPPETPLPLAGRTLLLSLRDGRFASAAAMRQAISDLLSLPAAYPKSRRAIQVGAAAAFPIVVAVISIIAILVLQSSKAGDRTLFTLDACLNELERAEKTLKKGPNPRVQQMHDDVEIYLAEHFKEKIQSESTWNQTFPNVGSRGGRARATRALEAHETRTPEEVRRADATVAGLLDGEGKGLEKLVTMRALATVAVAIFAGTFAIPAFFAGIGALIIGSGFTFRPMGAAIVNRRGQPISRARALVRAILTWWPIVVIVLLMKRGPDVSDTEVWRLLLEIALLLILATGAAWAIARPSRGIQDRLAGSWIVPR